MTKFGQAGLNHNLNSNSNTLQTNKSLDKNSLENLIVVGRVVDIILDENHPKFTEQGGWSSIGTIEFVNTNAQSSNSAPGSSKLYAHSLFPNQKNYPIFNETVYILSLPDQGVMEDGASRKFYYLNPINVWNHPHHNAVPFYISKEATDTQNKTYEATALGSVNKTKNTQSKINLGPGFKEFANIHPLNYFLGDYILEGRWGNSIRFGSTHKSSLNNWSSNGENGNPITIIRNGQPKNSTDEGWLPITENINTDLSSIYLTSNQVIPLKPSSELYNSYKKLPTSINKFNGSQLIFCSERIVFNSTKDHILFSSPTSIGFSSQDGINLDSKNYFTLTSKKIILGDKNTKNPMLLGNETVDVIKTICEQIINLTEALSALAEIVPAAPQVAVNIAASEAVAQISLTKGTLESLKSKINFLS
jgi:hypothetical protein